MLDLVRYVNYRYGYFTGGTPKDVLSDSKG